MIYPSCLWPWRTYFASNTEVDERTNCTTQYILKKVNNLKGLDCRDTPSDFYFSFSSWDDFLFAWFWWFRFDMLKQLWKYACHMSHLRFIVIVLIWSYFFHIDLGWCCSYGWVESYNERPARSRNDDNCWFNKWPGVYISIFLFFGE